MRHYNKFYEIGNNKYYTLVADGDLFLGTESFVQVGKNILGRPKLLTQGFKLLEITVPITMLFLAIDNLKPKNKQKYDSDDIIEYDLIDTTELKCDLIAQYENAIAIQHSEVDSYYQTQIDSAESEEAKKILRDKQKEAHKVVEENNPLNKLDLVNPIHTGCATIKSMLRSGLNHLYTSKVTAFASNVFLYEQDCFGQITIYRIMTIKNVVKSIDSFIYDKKLISAFLKSVEEKEI